MGEELDPQKMGEDEAASVPEDGAGEAAEAMAAGEVPMPGAAPVVKAETGVEEPVVDEAESKAASQNEELRAEREPVVGVAEPVVARGPSDEEVKAESRKRTRRSFVVGGVAAAAGYGLFHLIDVSDDVGRLQGGLRQTLQADAAINRAVWGERGLAPEYPVSRAKELRLNGVVGMDQTLDVESWRLQLAGVAGAARYPQYVKDVTGWEYKYVGGMEATPQTEDVKSAPASTGKVKPGDPQPQAVDGPTVGGGNAGLSAAAQERASGRDDRAVGARSANSGGDDRAVGSSLNPGGAVDSAAGAALAARIEAMMKSQQTKRNEGTAEAGASYSSLDIGTPGLLLTMADLQKLPKVDVCLEFKCIEGWSEIAQWGGYRMRDLLEMYPPEKVNGREPRYVYIETPDGNYYGGYDLKVARHPQTLLVTEMAGQPLTQVHGAPLRLYTPLKYGYKQVKRIGLIAYTDQKPDDFWTKLGYDWYAGL